MPKDPREPEDIIDEISKQDFAAENAELREKLEGVGAERLALKTENEKLRERLAVFAEQERTDTAEYYKTKSNFYFKSQLETNQNEIQIISDRMKNTLKERMDAVLVHQSDAYDALKQKERELLEEIKRFEIAEKEQIKTEITQTAQQSREEISALLQKPVEKETLDELLDFKPAKKRGNMEAFIGNNLINKVGVLFLLFGLIAFARNDALNFSDASKGILMFVLSGVLLFAGDRQNRKAPSIFSWGLTGGGIAGIFISTLSCYFAFHIINPIVMCLICLLAAALSFVLSVRYDSKVVAAFAVIGGYLPVISANGWDALSVIPLSIYIMAFNLFAFIMMSRRKWHVPVFVGFFLNLIASTVIVIALANQGLVALAFLFELISFGAYVAIPFLSNYRENLPFVSRDVVLLSFNTVYSSINMYLILAISGLWGFSGILTIALAIIYIILGFIVSTFFMTERFGGQNDGVLALFRITAIAFAVLAIPLQLDSSYLSVGWVLEATILVVYGAIAGKKLFRYFGFGVFIMCVLSFLANDLIYSDIYIVGRYSFITLSLLCVFAAYSYKNIEGKFFSFLRFTVLLNLWVYAGSLAHVIGNHSDILRELYAAIFIAVTVALAQVYLSMNRLRGASITVLSVSMNIYAILYTLAINGQSITADKNASALVVFILIVISAATITALMNLMKLISKDSNDPEKTAGYTPVVLTVYLLLAITQVFIAQYDVSFVDATISIIYIIAAFLLIIFGFTKSQRFSRRFGLGLSLVSLAKLCFIDLMWLSPNLKVAAYFSFGAALIAISYVYQRFSKTFGGDKE
ncbi:hypothetical protein FACS1894188_08480 [Clostridia bacterium]|nr:hypothetical protein FACS1894188_08480 [Clostridia bacterium]